MTYIIRYIDSKGETISVEESFEHPSEDYLRAQVALLNAEFADVCRAED